MDNISIELEALERVLTDECAEPIKLSYGLLRSVTDNFSNEIGRGGFGVVYMGYLGIGKVAVKRLSNAHALPDKQFLDEIMCLKRSNHKNIVRFLGYCSETQGELLKFNDKDVMAEVQKKLLCFEYVPNGNIRHYLEQEKAHGDDWPARYQMIIGICHGLQCLHDKKINHLDLKPENVMLDAQMEPKITDFGLSRLLDQGQSKMVTQHIVGTLRYIAPEIVDKGEISFKSDIYALGIIIIELLTGISLISLENWDESLDVDSPRVRRCTEIARSCTDPDKHNRPTIHEVISELDGLESMIPRSPVNQVIPTAFPSDELFDVYPLELRFPFVPNQEMHCHLSVTNNHTDDGIYCIIVSGAPDRYKRLFGDLLLPMSTTAITLRKEAEEQPPSATDELEIVMLITGCDENVFHQKMRTLSKDKVASFEDMLKAAHELLGFELHRTTLKAIVVVSEDDDRALGADTISERDETSWSSYMDVHPTEPWVLSVQHREVVYIWNWHTNEKLGEYCSCAEIPGHRTELNAGKQVAKFIPQKQWAVTGNLSGSILVCTCPSMDLVKEFKAHRNPVTSLAVHSTRPLLLSCSNDALSLKLWDWSRGWYCAGSFDIAGPVREIMFNPKHASTFATCDNGGTVEMWRFGHPGPVAATHYLDHFGSSRFFTYCDGDQHFIAASNNELICIWDLQKEKHVHTLHIEVGTVAIACHPTCPVLVTASKDGSIRVWDSTTYRLKKTYVNCPMDPIHIGFTGSKRLVIGYRNGVSVLDIDLD